MTRILLVDDHPLLRRGVRQLLAMEPGFETVGECGTGDEALALTRSLAPDLVLLDLNMHGKNGIDILQELRAVSLTTRVVILTVSDSYDDVEAALRAGADGYLLKDMEPEELVDCLHRAAAGEIVVSEGLAPLLARALGGGRQAKERLLEALTAREKDILRHLARGESNKVIARNLGITEGTIKVHMKNLLRKMQLRSRVEAAVWAVRNGLR